ncbi:catalase 1 [Sporothrix curviconia]|uniref:catalase n=1 Tax=Sporothrix curviconia TaxID=1260050 RepID=A0ABP0AZP6_9PEZI
MTCRTSKPASDSGACRASNDVRLRVVHERLNHIGPGLLREKAEPHNEVSQAQTAHSDFWDFMLIPRGHTHMSMWAVSDRAIPRTYRIMQGFGINAFTLINTAGERCFAKFPPELGLYSLVWDGR